MTEPRTSIGAVPRGKVKIVKKHETPIRVGAVGGENLDAGQAGLVVVGVSDMGAKVAAAMAKADKVEQKQLEADTTELQKDAATDG